MKIAPKAAVLMGFALTLAAAAGPVRWADLYRTGKMAFKADPAFGRGVDWSTELFDDFQEVAVAPDGSVFVVNVHRDTIRKFDPSGRPVRTFGKSGQGPGDLQTPGSPGILDGRYLVVSEYATLQRISLFDLEGRFVKILKTERPVFDVVPLRGGRIAYLSTTSKPTGGVTGTGARSVPAEDVVAVKDVATGTERIVKKAAASIDGIVMSGGGMIGFGETLKGKIFIQATAEGDLAVGFSAAPLIEIFSPQGEPLRRWNLDLPPVRVRPEHAASLRKSFFREGGDDPRAKSLQTALAKVDFAPLFGEILPLYRDMRVDSEGNYLFFLRNEDFGSKPVRVAAYTAQGRPIGRFEIDPGDFEAAFDPRFRTIQFSASGLIGIAPRKDDPDGSPRLFRCLF